MNAIEERHWRVLAHCLKERRKMADLTQEALALAAGLSPSEIQHIERGRRRPGSGTIRRICEVLGISQAELYAQVDRVDREWERQGR